MFLSKRSSEKKVKYVSKEYNSGMNVEFLKRTLIVQACQCNELDLLIPLWFQASKLVLVGDPEQLPSTIMSMVCRS